MTASIHTIFEQAYRELRPRAPASGRIKASPLARKIAQEQGLERMDLLLEEVADERAEGAEAVREHIARIFRNNPTLRFTTRSFYAGEDFAVCEWTATTGSIS